MKDNKIREIEIEKVVLAIGALGESLEKAAKLLNIVSGMKATKTKARKRIPAFGIRPGLEIGCKVTMRGKKAEEILKKLLTVKNNELKAKQINDEDFSFGIEEYIEIPGIEYQRDIGMIGLNVTVVFKRKGKRVEIKKIKQGRIPKRQRVTKQEVIDYLQTKLNVKVEEKK
jgi:large subunit ribosomal protein L5